MSPSLLKTSASSQNNWRMDQRVVEVRKYLLMHIVQLFKTLMIAPDQSVSDSAMLPIVQYLEKLLFDEAVSLEEYSNTKTLKKRLLQVVKLYQDAIVRLRTRSVADEVPQGAWMQLPVLEDIYNNGTGSQMHFCNQMGRNVALQLETSQMKRSQGSNMSFSPESASLVCSPSSGVSVGESSAGNVNAHDFLQPDLHKCPGTRLDISKKRTNPASDMHYSSSQSKREHSMQISCDGESSSGHINKKFKRASMQLPVLGDIYNNGTGSQMQFCNQMGRNIAWQLETSHMKTNLGSNVSSSPESTPLVCSPSSGISIGESIAGNVNAHEFLQPDLHKGPGTTPDISKKRTNPASDMHYSSLQSKWEHSVQITCDGESSSGHRNKKFKSALSDSRGLLVCSTSGGVGLISDVMHVQQFAENKETGLRTNRLNVKSSHLPHMFSLPTMPLVHEHGDQVLRREHCQPGSPCNQSLNQKDTPGNPSKGKKALPEYQTVDIVGNIGQLEDQTQEISQLQQVVLFRKCLQRDPAPNLAKASRRSCGYENVDAESKLQARHKFFHAYMHGRSCISGEECQVANCRKIKDIIVHSSQCTDEKCGRFRCHEYQGLMRLYDRYSNTACLICRPIHTSSQEKCLTSSMRAQEPPDLCNQVSVSLPSCDSETESSQFMLPLAGENNASKDFEENFKELQNFIPANTDLSNAPHLLLCESEKGGPHSVLPLARETNVFKKDEQNFKMLDNSSATAMDLYVLPEKEEPMGLIKTSDISDDVHADAVICTSEGKFTCNSSQAEKMPDFMGVLDPPIKHRKLDGSLSTFDHGKEEKGILLSSSGEISQKGEQNLKDLKIPVVTPTKLSLDPQKEELTHSTDVDIYDEIMSMLDIPDDEIDNIVGNALGGTSGSKETMPDSNGLSCTGSSNTSPFNNMTKNDSSELLVHEEGEEKPSEMNSSEKGVSICQCINDAEMVAMTDLFSLDQIEEHINSLRQWTGESKAETDKFCAAKIDDENLCKLCGVETLTFEPPAKYCYLCCSLIKRNAVYHIQSNRKFLDVTDGSINYFCNRCFIETRNENFKVDGVAIDKFKLEKRKNNDAVDEPWVQCDNCQGWQHVVCALFNNAKTEKGARYICPTCCMEEIRNGKRKCLPDIALLGSKDIPSSALSDHIERHLCKQLEEEIKHRARILKKNSNEVPRAENLVVRVVSSVDKRVEVRERFRNFFSKNKYPDQFQYKSKAIVLFQMIDGVDVLLFTMYVQEFGSDCDPPNQRRVYLSYLDSVKYFQPCVKASTGEALRTFVYHEILVGYLDYIKKRGFTSIYIWACPPLKGEGYVFHCHPESQKIPKVEKLREWYKAVIHKAMKKGVVAGFNNLYDQFFVSFDECRTKVTAAKLPYFDGDYLPGAIDDTITSILQDKLEAKLHNKPRKRSVDRRSLKYSGYEELSTESATDIELMLKLGEVIHQSRESFILVHLQHSCNRCSEYILCSRRWDCVQCTNFHLCSSCYFNEKKTPERERHPLKSREKHNFRLVQSHRMPWTTTDDDHTMRSDIFESRQTFLEYCQQNNLQYDTIRRAKHSSMMVLHQVHESLKWRD